MLLYLQSLLHHDVIEVLMLAHVGDISPLQTIFHCPAFIFSTNNNENFLADIIVPIPMVYACFGTCFFDSKTLICFESFSG